MRERAAIQQAAEIDSLCRSYPWLEALLRPLDSHLRHRQKIYEYTNSPDCVFRIQLISNSVDVLLSDRTSLHLGDRLIDLHLWNEHVPAMPAQGATLAWARRVDRCIDVSLGELARYLAARPDLSDVRGIRANMSFGTAERSDQILRIARRYGFEPIPAPPLQTLGARMHRLGENILISMLILARNARALRADTLWRDRTLAYLSRQTLERLYGTD